MFSAPSDAPRVRRTNDLVGVVGAGVVLFVIGLVAWDGSTLDQDWADLVAGLPGWVRWLGQVAHTAGILYGAALIVGVAAVARDRLELVRDLVLAAVLAVGSVIVLSWWFDGRWPDVDLFTPGDLATTFPAVSVAAVVSVQAAAAPHLSAPLRRAGHRVVLAGAAGAVLGGLARPTATVGALVIGLMAASTVRYVMGTTAGLPSLARVRSGLSAIGVAMTDLTYLEEQPASSAMLAGVTADGGPAYVRVLGRDAWAAGRWARRWRSAWYQDDGPEYASSRREQVEHEALAMALAARAGVRVPDLLGVGMSDEQDALLVADGGFTTSGAIGAEQLDDALLDGWWAQLRSLHEGGMAHCGLGPGAALVDGAGRPALGGLSVSALVATDQQRNEDVAAMLVTLGVLAGADRSIESARRVIGDDVLLAALPMLQPAALSTALRRSVPRARSTLKEARRRVAEAIGVDPPDIEQLHRVSVGQVVMVAFGVFAAYTLISGLADVGFDTIADALADAEWPLLIAALIAVQLTNATDADAIVALTPKPVPIGVATLEQLAISFINLAVPSSAGRLTMNARFFQKFGISPITSTSTSLIVSAVALLAQVILLVATVVVGRQSIDLTSLQGGSGVVKLVGLAVAVALVGALVVLAVPTLRAAVKARLAGPAAQLRSALSVVRDPRHLARALGASLASQVLFALGLVLCVQALGGELTLGQALFINITVSVFAGASPVPGGIGVAEAGLTAGLVGVGLTSDVAVPAVILYRMVSYYLPPVWGWVSLNWLTRNDYL